MRRSFLIVTALAVAALGQTGVAQAPQKRPLRASDLLAIRGVNDPQLSPDGAWVAYSVTAIDSAKDKSDTDLWMTSWDGTTTIRLTSRVRALRGGAPMAATSDSSPAARKERVGRSGSWIAEEGRRSA